MDLKMLNAVQLSTVMHQKCAVHLHAAVVIYVNRSTVRLPPKRCPARLK